MLTESGLSVCAMLLCRLAKGCLVADEAIPVSTLVTNVGGQVGPVNDRASGINRAHGPRQLVSPSLDRSVVARTRATRETTRYGVVSRTAYQSDIAVRALAKRRLRMWSKRAHSI
jgi:hypothetical protein